MDGDWSIKKLNRWTMLSSAYQQTSADRPDERAIDSENKFLWRMNRQRLDYESLRDAILFVSGRLDQAIGGLPFALDSQPTVPRRTAYAYLQRGRLPGELSAFDFAIPDAHVPQRFLTTVPQQALFLMNSPFIMEQSRHLMGRRDIDSAAPNMARVEALYRLVFGRAATSEEAQLALDYVKGEDATPAPPRTLRIWQYGLASSTERGETSNFEPMKYFTNKKWEPASLTPPPVFGNAELSAEGALQRTMSTGQSLEDGLRRLPVSLKSPERWRTRCRPALRSIGSIGAAGCARHSERQVHSGGGAGK